MVTQKTHVVKKDLLCMVLEVQEKQSFAVSMLKTIKEGMFVDQRKEKQ